MFTAVRVYIYIYLLHLPVELKYFEDSALNLTALQ